MCHLLWGLTYNNQKIRFSFPQVLNKSVQLKIHIESLIQSKYNYHHVVVQKAKDKRFHFCHTAKIILYNFSIVLYNIETCRSLRAL